MLNVNLQQNIKLDFLPIIPTDKFCFSEGEKTRNTRQKKVCTFTVLSYSATHNFQFSRVVRYSDTPMYLSKTKIFCATLLELFSKNLKTQCALSTFAYNIRQRYRAALWYIYILIFNMKNRLTWSTQGSFQILEWISLQNVHFWNENQSRHFFNEKRSKNGYYEHFLECFLFQNVLVGYFGMLFAPNLHFLKKVQFWNVFFSTFLFANFFGMIFSPIFQAKNWLNESTQVSYQILEWISLQNVQFGTKITPDVFWTKIVPKIAILNIFGMFFVPKCPCLIFWNAFRSKFTIFEKSTILERFSLQFFSQNISERFLVQFFKWKTDWIKLFR